MNNQFTQPKNGVSKETNKEAIARIYGVFKSEVLYLKIGHAIDGYKLLYDASTETIWRVDGSGFIISWDSQSTGQLRLITSAGTLYLVEAAAYKVSNTISSIMPEMYSSTLGTGGDDTAALQKAFTTAATLGLSLKLSKNYLATANITISSMFVDIYGVNQYTSGITFTPGFGIVVDNSATTVVRKPLSMSNMHLKTKGLREGVALTFTGNGGIRYAKQLILRDVDISSADDGNYAFATCFKLYRAGQSLFDNVNVSGAGTSLTTSLMGKIFDLNFTKNLNIVNGSFQNFDTFMDAHDDTEGIFISGNHIIAGRRGVVSENNVGNAFWVIDNHFNTTLSAVELGDGSVNGGNHSVIKGNFCIVFNDIAEDATTPYVGIDVCSSFNTIQSNQILRTATTKDSTAIRLKANTAGTRVATANTVSDNIGNQLSRNIVLNAGVLNNNVYGNTRIGISLVNDIIDNGTNTRYWILESDSNRFMTKDIKLCDTGKAGARSIGFYSSTDPNVVTAQLRVSGGVAGVGNDGTGEFTGPVLVTKKIRPSAANTYTLGDSTYPWSGGFTQTAFTVISDEQEKSRPEDITDTMLDAWEEVDFCQYQYIDRILVKGNDEARWHFGLVAQRAEEAFARHGLNASDFAFFCRDTKEEQLELVDSNNVVYQEYHPAFTKCGIRYEEALVLEAALQRRRYTKLEERIKALESK